MVAPTDIVDAASEKETINKTDIEYIRLHSNYVEFVPGDHKRYSFSNVSNSIGALVVDSVDAAAPSSLSDLYDKLAALIQ